MFESLSERLSGVFNKLTRQGALSEKDVETALKEIRAALIEADVSLSIVRSFIKSVGKKATGQAVTKSVTPGQQVVKIVHDELINILTDSESSSDLKIDNPPAPILMVGLQGSGKTTTTAKLANKLIKGKRKVLMASLDTSRPAAMEQLAVLGQQSNIDTLPIKKDETAVNIAKRAKQQATLGGYDVYILDTAGRLHVEDSLMEEVKSIKEISKPHEILLVVDGLTGQDAVNVAEEFDNKLNITGVVLTRMDGDGRGGAALSMKAITGKPIKFIGVGEKIDALEEFVADRIAGRILGMGDIVSLVEKAQETFEAEKAERMMKRLQKGQFNMNDLKSQMEQMKKMGGMQSIMSMMPGMGKLSKNLNSAGFDDKMIGQQVALINSMTKRERVSPQILQASRKKRIAKGAGLEVSDLNKLIKMQRQMSDTMKKLGKSGGRGMISQMMQMISGKSGKGVMPPANIDELNKLAKGNSQSLISENFGDISKNPLPFNFTGLGRKNK